MRRCWFFIFPFLGSRPMASRHGQWPDPWAGVAEWCSLLTGHREITGGGEASIESSGSGGSRFRIVESHVDQPFKYVATWLIDEWSKIALHATHLDADCRRGELYAPRVWGGPAFPLRAAKHWL